MSLVIAVVASVTVASPASANWSGASGVTGRSGGINVADNKVNSWYPYVLTSQVSTAVTSMVNYIDTTAVDEVQASSLTSSTDTVYSDGAYTNLCGQSWYSAGGGTVGYAVCDSLTSWSGCQSHSVYISSDFVVDTPSKAKPLVLHESGHALGLTHLSVSGEVMHPTVGTITTFSTHDTQHLTNDLRN